MSGYEERSRSRRNGRSRQERSSRRSHDRSRRSSRSPRSSRPSRDDRDRRDRRGSRGANRGRHARQPQRRRPIVVPFVYVLVLLVVGVGVSVLVTRAVMQPRIDEATAQANEAQEQVNTLTKRLENTIREATENEAALKAELEKAGKKSKDSEGGGTKSPWISSGGLSTGDETLDGEVKAFCDARTDSSMSQETAALEVYKGVAWSEYVERDDAQHPSGPNWRAEYARKYYENGCTGNCYEFAAFLMYCLRYLGYTDAQAEGVGIELESGMLGDHGLVFVTNTDGSACLCDTARGTDGWMIPADSYNMEIQDFESA